MRKGGKKRERDRESTQKLLMAIYYVTDDFYFQFTLTLIPMSMACSLFHVSYICKCLYRHKRLPTHKMLEPFTQNQPIGQCAWHHQHKYSHLLDTFLLHQTFICAANNNIFICWNRLDSMCRTHDDISMLILSDSLDASWAVSEFY